VHPIVSMPAFARGLTDDELAALANFTIEHFGRRPANVSAKNIEHARAKKKEANMIDIRRKSLVTGANRGLRHAFAVALREAGARNPSTVSFTWRSARCT
jgi:hypothetical protein